MTRLAGDKLHGSPLFADSSSRDNRVCVSIATRDNSRKERISRGTHVRRTMYDHLSVLARRERARIRGFTLRKTRAAKRSLLLPHQDFLLKGTARASVARIDYVRA